MTHPLVAAARRYMGAVWKHQGRRPQALDCLGLIVLALRDIGVDVEDRQGYGRTPYNGELAKALRRQFGEPVGDLKPGDVVTMTWAGEEHHVAIVTDHPEGLGLIHSLVNVGRVVEHRLSPDYRARIVEAYRI